MQVFLLTQLITFYEIGPVKSYVAHQSHSMSVVRIIAIRITVICCYIYKWL